VRDLLLKEISKKDIVVALAGIELALHVSKLLPNKPKVQVLKPMAPPCCVLKIPK
jgi:tRNA nucleotidyltransferase (CCA-adding enzyme)